MAIPTRTFEVNGQRLRMVDLEAAVRALGGSLSTMPYTIRVLVENMLRAQLLRGPSVVSAREIAAIIEWERNVGADVPLFVARVILPDSSGVPVLQDLAALRDAIADGGGDAARVDTVLPLDIVIDHSLQV